MATTKAGEQAARIRAAQAYAGLKNDELAPQLGISVETLSRIKNGATKIDPGFPARVAAECGVPTVFMDVGFAPLERPITDVERRVFDLERQAGERLEALEAAIFAVTGEAEIMAGAQADDDAATRVRRAAATLRLGLLAAAQAGQPAPVAAPSEPDEQDRPRRSVGGDAA